MESQKEVLPGRGGAIATLFVIAGSVLYSTKSLFVKRMMLESIDSGEILTMRLVWSAPVYLGVIAWILLGHRGRWKDVAKMFLLGLWGFWLAPRLNFAGLGRTSAGLERILVQASTAFVILFVAVSLRRCPSRTVMVSVVVCYLGMLLALVGRDEGRPFADPVGVGLILAGAVAWALFVVGVGKLQERLGSGLCTSVGMVAAALPALVETISTGDPVQVLRPSASILWPLAGLVVVGTVVPSFLSQAGLSRVGPVRASVLSLVGPAVLPFLASAMLRETMPVHQIAGLSVVLASCALMTLRG
ncbi:MAG TPA: DMT family transporter [Fibrobacteria bacterium]|nr:DMT family transporter [Fibrobacteria bacterium]HOX50188.1 DMT family transporter [Fibrobacteria bacterium]